MLNRYRKTRTISLGKKRQLQLSRRIGNIFEKDQVMVFYGNLREYSLRIMAGDRMLLQLTGNDDGMFTYYRECEIPRFLDITHLLPHCRLRTKLEQRRIEHSRGQRQMHARQDWGQTRQVVVQSSLTGGKSS